MLCAVGERNFDRKIESDAVRALKKIQDIMLNDETEDGYKVLQIEDLLLDYNLEISPRND